MLKIGVSVGIFAYAVATAFILPTPVRTGRHDSNQSGKAGQM